MDCELYYDLGSPECRAEQNQDREEFQSSQEHQDGENGLGRCGQIGIELRGSGRSRERARYVHAREDRPESLPHGYLVQGDEKSTNGHGCHVHEEEAEDPDPNPLGQHPVA